MHGNAMQAHDADPAIDWLAEFEAEEPAAPPAHEAPELTMDPAVEPESRVHASTRLIARLPRLATVRPEDTLFRVVVPPRTPTLDPIEAARFAPIEPDPIAETARRVKSAWPRLSNAWHRRSVRVAAMGVIVLGVLSTGVLAGGSALRRWGRPPEPPGPPLVAVQAAPSVPADSSSTSPGASQETTSPPPARAAVTDTRADSSKVGRTRAPATSKPPAAASAPPPSVIPPPVPTPAPVASATDSRSASTPPPVAPPQLNGVTSAAASPVRTMPVTIEAPPARTPVPTPAPVRAEPRPAAPAAAPPPPRVPDAALIQSVVDRYAHALSTLSLDGITAFWPTVNTRALAKAFDQLQEQHLALDSCRIDVHGDQADAICGGQARFVPKIGSHTPRTERHQWAFALLRQTQGWVIYKVDVK